MLNIERRHRVLGFEAGKTLFTWTGEEESANRSQKGGNIFFALMIILPIHSRLTWREVTNADIEADGAAFVVLLR